MPCRSSCGRVCRSLTFSKKLGDLSLPSRLLCSTQCGAGPLVGDRRAGRLQRARAVSATGSETEWRLLIALQMDKGPNVCLNALPTQREAAAWLLHFISKETEPLCSHVANIAQCKLAGNHRGSVGARPDRSMLSCFLSAARRYIAEVQSATSLVRDPSPCEVMLWDFSKPHSVAQWDCLSDQEMEGQSDATFQSSDKGTRTVTEGKRRGWCVCASSSLQGMPPSLAVSLPSSHLEETCCTAAMPPLGQGQQRCMCTLTSVLHDRRSSLCTCVCSLLCCMTGGHHCVPVYVVFCAA